MLYLNLPTGKSSREGDEKYPSYCCKLLLNKIKESIIFQVSFDEIECVRAYVRLKEKIAKKNKQAYAFARSSNPAR